MPGNLSLSAPAAITLAFQKSFSDFAVDAVYHITVTVPGGGRAGDTRPMRAFPLALYGGLVAGTPSNLSALTAYANQVAADYGAWCQGPLHIRYAGAVDYTPEGFHEIEWMVRDGEMGTLVRRCPFEYPEIYHEVKCCTEHVRLTGAVSVTSSVAAGTHTVTPPSMLGVFPGATLTATGSVSTSASGSVSTGTVTPTSMDGIFAGQVLHFHDGSNDEDAAVVSITSTTFNVVLVNSYTNPTITSVTDTTETVTISSTTSTTFTATFTYPYAATWTLTAYGPPWPGVYALWDAGGGAFVDMANVWIVSPNAESLAVGVYYHAKAAPDPLGGEALFVTQQVGAGGGSSLAVTDGTHTVTGTTNEAFDPTYFAVSGTTPNAAVTFSTALISILAGITTLQVDDANGGGMVSVDPTVKMDFPKGTVAAPGAGVATINLPRVGSEVFNTSGNRVLYADGSSNLGSSSNFTYVDATSFQVLNTSEATFTTASTGIFNIFGLGGNSEGMQWTDGTHIVTFDQSVGLIINVGNCRVQGTASNTFEWLTTTSAPTPNVVGGLPLSMFGGATSVQGTPDVWLYVEYNGSPVKIAGYYP